METVAGQPESPEGPMVELVVAMAMEESAAAEEEERARRVTALRYRFGSRRDRMRCPHGWHRFS